MVHGTWYKCNIKRFGVVVKPSFGFDILETKKSPQLFKTCLRVNLR